MKFLSVSLIILLISLSHSNSENFVCYKENCFDVELALTPHERSKGLMFREKLGKDKGMLFIYNSEDERSFWMKNTLIPLDIIWIDKNNTVIYINKYTQPCKEYSCPSINPKVKSKYILELNAGISDTINLTEGKKILIILDK